MAEVDVKTAEPAPDPLIGRVLNGRFSILEAIGSGGMGRVYKAIQSPLDRVVAVKVLHPHYAGRDTGFVKRFVLEASLTSKLRHPNTVTVIDYGQTEDSVFFIAMELLEGNTVAEVIAKQGPFDWKRTVHIGQQVCRSLREAHKFGIIHRDLKPANVMLLDEADHDVVKVLDFGLVKSFVPEGQAPTGDSQITQAGMLLGSPQYMAPEQARHQSDPRSDVYSFGILLFEMMAGKPPFQAKDYLEVIVKHLKEPPPSIRTVRPQAVVPDSVEALVQRCLQKDPAARFSSMDDLLDALRSVAGGAVLSTNTENRTATGWTQSTPPPVPNRSGLATPMPGAIRSGAPMTPAPALPASESGLRRAPPAAQPVRPSPPPQPPLFASQINVRVPVEPSAPQSQTALFTSAQTSSTGRSGGMIVLVGFIVAVIGGSAWWFTRDARPPVPVASTTAAASTPTTEGAAPPATAKSVRFRVSSDPAGARVFTGARDLGVTPVVFELPAQADGTATAELIFVLDGFHPLAVTAGGSGDVVLSQRLQKKGNERSTASQSSSAARTSAAAKGETSEGNNKVEETTMFADPVGAMPAHPAVLEAVGSKVTDPIQGAVAPPALAAVAPVVTKGGNEPLSFSEGMTRPVQIQSRLPEYTREAIQAHVEGLMIVKCVITATGRVEKCRVLKGLPYMEQPVLESLYGSLYKPVTLQGKPVAVDYVFDIHLVPPRH